jgi:cyclophilin family peptidyl-prolyl cis-trans isomerase
MFISYSVSSLWRVSDYDTSFVSSTGPRAPNNERQRRVSTRPFAQNLRLAEEPVWDRRQLMKQAGVLLELLAISSVASAKAAQVADNPPTQHTSCRAGTPFAKVTDKARFVLQIGTTSGSERLPLVIGLFGTEAPEAVERFKQLVEQRLVHHGRQLGYSYTTASRIIPNQRIELGRISQLEDLATADGVPLRPRMLLSPGTRDRNALRHRCAGTVSIPHEPGRGFEFCILPVDVSDEHAFVQELDAENVVIGCVIQGMDTVRQLNEIPVSRPTPRDMLRRVGQALGDVRARQDPTWRPLRKVRILECSLIP